MKVYERDLRPYAPRIVYLGGRSGLVAYQREPHPTISKGERFGSLDKPRLKADLPAARHVILDDEELTVVLMEEGEFQAEYAHVLFERIHGNP